MGNAMAQPEAGQRFTILPAPAGLAVARGGRNLGVPVRDRPGRTCPRPAWAYLSATWEYLSATGPGVPVRDEVI
jgi:hypothetical protein